jgi:hypothetical protein
MVEQSPMLEVNQCPSWAAALGYGGVAFAVCLSNWGAAVSHDGYYNGTNDIQASPSPTLGEGYSTNDRIGSDRIRLDLDHDAPFEPKRRSD